MICVPHLLNEHKWPTVAWLLRYWALEEQLAIRGLRLVALQKQGDGCYTYTYVEGD